MTRRSYQGIRCSDQGNSTAGSAKDEIAIEADLEKCGASAYFALA
jgi:hypothetical protein